MVYVHVGGEGCQDLLVSVLEKLTEQYKALLARIQERYSFHLDQLMSGRLELLSSRRHRREVCPGEEGSRSESETLGEGCMCRCCNNYLPQPLPGYVVCQYPLCVFRRHTSKPSTRPQLSY